MQKLLKWFAVAALSLVFLTIVVAVLIHREFDGVRMFVDDELVTGPLVALAVVAALSAAVFVALFVALAAVASVVLLVPLVVGVVVVMAIVALVVGLAPLLVPVLLVVGACVLLVRLSRRPRTALPATVAEPRLHA